MKITKYKITIIIATILFAMMTTSITLADTSNPECPPNSDHIWISREQHLPLGVEPHPVHLAFSEGMTEDPYEGILINNYLAGVLEREMGPTDESPELHPEAGKAIAIAARSVAYRWCNAAPVTVTDSNGVSHSGVNDHSRQHYDPNHVQEPAIDEQYRQFVSQTAGQHLTYNNQYFALLFRTYVSPQTGNLSPSPPHKSVWDPVSSPDELQNSGMGLHSANHWAIGEHNSVGCNFSLVCSENSPGPSDWRLNPVWDHWQILAHYYSKVDFQNFPNYVPPDHRWNMLSTSLHSPIDNPTTLETGTTRPVTIQLQNSSFVSFTNNNQRRNHLLIYTWVPCTSGSPFCPDIYANPEQQAQLFAPGYVPTPVFWGEVPIPVPVQPADDTTVTIALSTPDFAGDYILRWDIQREENDGSGNWVTVTFGANGWPEQEEYFKVRSFPYRNYLPAMTKQ